jgi:hypothetical protein
MWHDIKMISLLTSRHYLHVALLVLCLILAGCGSINKSSFRDMSTAYRELVEEYTNDNLLINIVRSSEDMPLSFLDIPSVTGSGSVSPAVSAGISGLSAQASSLTGFFSAADGSSYSLGATLSVNNSFTFTQSSLDNGTFMTQFLAPLSLNSIQNLSMTEVLNQAVLYAMIIKSISIVDQEGITTIKLINNPYSPHYPDFQLALIRLVAARLNVEQEVKRVPVSPPLSIAEATKNLMAIATATSKPDIVLTPIPGKSGRPSLYQLEQMAMVPKLCFEIAEPLMGLDFSLPPNAFCGSTRKKVEKDEKLADAKKPVRNMSVEFRSPRDIFYFLGAVVNIQNDAADPRQIGVLPLDKIRAGLTVNDLQDGAKPLFVVKENPGSDIDPLVSLDYLGKTYVIPKSNSGFSREVLTILAQIVTLAKVPGSIPVSPAVLIQ